MPHLWDSIRAGLTWYTLLLFGGIGLSAFFWWRLTRDPARRDRRLISIYFAGLIGALVGAKFAFLFAEGWQYRHDLIALLSGKSITGGILGGYVAVEWAKRQNGYSRSTGDLFAITAPLGLALGRIGCLRQGCCAGIACDPHWWTTVDAAGVHRWPAQIAEFTFNIVFLAWALLAAKYRWFPNNRFHVFLITYGLFRFVHEFLRDEPTLIGPFTGYHVIAIAMVIFGIVRFQQRQLEAA